MKKNLCLFLVLMPLAVYGQTAQEIVDSADSAFTGDRIFSSFTMIIYNGDEAQPAQAVESYSMELNGRSQSLTVYRAPRRMRGTAYLMIDDELWIRFASTGRIRRMSSSARTNSAGGSDFSYADMGEGNRGVSYDYSPDLDGEDRIDGEDCYRIELLPRRDSGAVYERLVAFISKDTHRYLQIDYFEDGANIKSMFLSEYRESAGVFYPHLIVMESHVRPSRTVIRTEEFIINSDRVSERMFSTSYLESIR